MLQKPFVVLGALLLGCVVIPCYLPFAPIFGYTYLLAIGVRFVFDWRAGALKRSRDVASIWVMYLGFVMILNGIAICFDSPLGGAPLSEGQKRFGNRLAYLGATVSGVSAVAAYGLDRDRRPLRKVGARPDPLDDLCV